MRSFIALAAVAGLAVAQDTATLLTGPPMGVYKTANTQAPLTATTRTDVVLTTAAVHKRDLTSEPTGPPMGVYKTANWQPPLTAQTLTASSATATTAALRKRDDVCVAQPTGIAHSTTPDTPEAFQNDPYYSNVSSSAVTPSGYNQVFNNILAANSADNYMGFTFLDTYDVQACGSQCSSINGCASFNIYFERDPTLAPDANACPNPPSLTRVKCVWWGGLVSLDNANNYGNMQASFYVLVAGSNGYVSPSAAASISASQASAATATQSAAMAQVTASDSSVWTVYYSSDSTQGSFSNAQASSSFTDCMTICDNTAGCSAFTYVGGDNGVGSGTCWLKTDFGSATSAGTNYVAAVRVSSPSSAATISTASSSSSSSSSTASPAPSTSTASQTSSSSSSSSTQSTVNIIRPTYGSAQSSTAPATQAYYTTSFDAAAYSVSSTSSTVSSSSSAVTSSSTSVASSSSSSSNTSSTLASSSYASTTSASLTAPAAGQKYDSSSSTSSTSSTILSATSSAPSSTIPATSSSSSSSFSTPAPTTFATSTKASTTSTSSSTTSSTTSAVPTAFYMQVGPSQSANNMYAQVNFWAGGKVQFTNNKNSATVFKIDSNGFLTEQNPNLWLLSGYKASVPFKGGAWQRLGFLPLVFGVDPAGCYIKDGMVQCANSGGNVFAGTCNNDGFLYFGAPNQISRGCSWSGLYPVAA